MYYSNNISTPFFDIIKPKYFQFSLGLDFKTLSRPQYLGLMAKLVSLIPVEKYDVSSSGSMLNTFQLIERPQTDQCLE